MKLKIIYIIVFLMPIMANEIILKLSNFELIEINMMEDFHDDSSEKESKEQNEDESKFEYFLDSLSLNNCHDNLLNLRNSKNSNSIPNPLLEIFSPPPEFI